MQCNTKFLVTLYAFFFGTFSNIVNADDGEKAYFWSKLFMEYNQL